MRQLTLAVDVDEVCADLLGEWLRRYNEKFDDNLTPDEATEWDLTKVVKKECGSMIYAFLHHPDLYDHVLPISGARKAVYELLAMGHRVVYVTACPGNTAPAKRDWLLRWGFLSHANVSRDFAPVQDKSLIRADILFDDRFDNVKNFPGLGVLITRKHNEFEPAWHRLPSLAHAPAFVRSYLM